MTDGLEIDIDRECIRHGDEWLTVADLTERIGEKIKAGDYRVSGLSLALERLQDTLDKIVPLELKVTPAVKANFQRIAAHEEKPLSSILRSALAHYLGTEDAARRLFAARKQESDGQS